MKSLQEKIFLALGLIIVAWSFYAVWNKPAPARYQQSYGASPIIRVGDEVIPIDIAETEAARTAGLSNRDSLQEGSGLLFVFDEPGMYGFWMKDMRFPIDIVWIDEVWRVVGVEKSAQPGSFPKVFYPASSVKFVLELNAGEAAKRGIDTGTKLFLDR